jgi:hypothetical protein
VLPDHCQEETEQIQAVMPSSFSSCADRSLFLTDHDTGYRKSAEHICGGGVVRNTRQYKTKDNTNKKKTKKNTLSTTAKSGKWVTKNRRKIFIVSGKEYRGKAAYLAYRQQNRNLNDERSSHNTDCGYSTTAVIANGEEATSSMPRHGRRNNSLRNHQRQTENPQSNSVSSALCASKRSKRSITKNARSKGEFRATAVTTPKKTKTLVASSFTATTTTCASDGPSIHPNYPSSFSSPQLYIDTSSIYDELRSHCKQSPTTSAASFAVQRCRPLLSSDQQIVDDEVITDFSDAPPNDLVRVNNSDHLTNISSHLRHHDTYSLKAAASEIANKYAMATFTHVNSSEPNDDSDSSSIRKAIAASLQSTAATTKQIVSRSTSAEHLNTEKDDDSDCSSIRAAIAASLLTAPTNHRTIEKLPRSPHYVDSCSNDDIHSKNQKKNSVEHKTTSTLTAPSSLHDAPRRRPKTNELPTTSCNVMPVGASSRVKGIRNFLQGDNTPSSCVATPPSPMVSVRIPRDFYDGGDDIFDGSVGMDVWETCTGSVSMGRMQ